MAGPATVEDYLAHLPDDRRAAMEGMRAAIRRAAPDDAVELISYQMPAFKTHGRFLVSYAAFQRHYSLFPASDAVITGLGDDIAPYLAGKGTIRFPADAPIPLELVERIVRIRATENEEAAARR